MIYGFSATSTVYTRSTDANIKVGTPVTSEVSSAAAAPSTAPPTKDTRTFSEVASEARKALDEGYAKLGKTGDIYTTGKEWDVAGMPALDRRELFAIMKNEGGHFSGAEQNAASAELADRGSAVMTAIDPTMRSSEAWKASVKFMDEASPEEKSTFEWAKQRAGVQWGYESISNSEGKVPEDLDSGNSLVNMLLKAWRELSNSEGTGQVLEDMPSYRQAWQLYAFEEPDQNMINWTL